MTTSISFLNQSLENGALERSDLGNAQKHITDRVSQSFYSSWSPRILEVFYNFAIAQIFHVSFYYDFNDKQIKCTVNKEHVTSDYTDNRDLDAKIEEKIQDFEFLLIDPIADNHGTFFYAKESRGKVRLICNETADPRLKEVVESALQIINKNR
jgi:hypothetical protein